MSRFVWLLFTMVALALLAAPALACPGHGEGFLKHHDSNGDGKVTLAEMQATAKKMFEELDKNGDGSIDASELDAMKGECPHCAAGKECGAGKACEHHGPHHHHGGKKPGQGKPKG